jgi:hypothetical protein
MDHAVELLGASKASPPLQDVDGDRVFGICCITGKETECVDRGAFLGKSFTAQSELRAPMSPLIGVTAARVLSYRPERGSSWWCDGKMFVPLRRVDVRERVLCPIGADRWAGYATTSYKKHGALRAPVNTGKRRVWLFENVLADLSDEAWAFECWKRLTDMQLAGWPRPVLEDLDPSPGMMIKLALKGWTEFERWARRYRESGAYQFLCYLLPSQKELAGDAEQD